MKLLIVLDDLSGLKASKNKLIQFFCKFYIAHLKFLLKTILTSESFDISGNEITLAGPREIISPLNLSGIRTCYYDELIDTVNWQEAGRISSMLAEQILDYDWTRILPEFFSRNTAIPKTCFVRLAQMFCYDPVAYSLIFKKLVSEYTFDKIITLSRFSEIERIALATFSPSAAIFESDMISQIKVITENLIHERDRRLHAATELRSIGTDLTKFKEIKRPLILAPSHSLHFKTLIPLAEKIKAAGERTPLTVLPVSLKKFEKILTEKGLSSTVLDSSNLIEERIIRSKLTSRLKSASRGILKQIIEARMMMYGGIDWASLLKVRLRNFFTHSFLEVFFLRIRFLNLFKLIKPEGVIVFSDARFHETSAASAAKDLRIPTFLYTPNPIMSLDQINRYNTCDYLLVCGSYMQKLLLEKGSVPSEKIVKVGDIRFDHLKISYTRENIFALKNKYGYADSDQIFLLVSWYTNLKFTLGEKELFFSIVRDAFNCLPNAKLIVKAHPNENEGELKKFCSKIGLRAPVIKEVPLYELLSISKAVILTASMTSLEAMAFNVPVLAVDLPTRDYDYYIPLKKGGGAIAFRNSDELIDVINRLMHDRGFEENQKTKGGAFLSNYLEISTKQNDSASERILETMDAKIEQYRDGYRRVVAIIQARMSSSRLPGKILRKLRNRTVLEWVVNQLRRTCLIDEIVIATSSNTEDDVIENESRHLNIKCFRGSLDNVLKRYVDAAQEYDADIIVRVTGDNVLIEPEWIDSAVSEILKLEADYVGAKDPAEFPTGMGCEVITRATLERSLKDAKSVEDFEHVTWYCLSHQNQFKIHFLRNPHKRHPSWIRLTLDEDRDFQLLIKLFDKLKGKILNYDSIMDLYDKNPGLFDINRSVAEKPNLYQTHKI